jgi:hypothetical protein
MDSDRRDLPAHVVVMEWHANGCPSSDACDLASRLLRDAGYVYQYREPGTHYSTGLLCARRWTSPPRVQRLHRP